MDQVALGELRRCLVPGCVYTVTNGLTDPDHILRAVSNHIAAIHPPTISGAGAEEVRNLQQQFHSWKRVLLKHSGMLENTDLTTTARFANSKTRT